jgi:hypothetical protein
MAKRRSPWPAVLMILGLLAGACGSAVPPVTSGEPVGTTVTGAPSAGVPSAPVVDHDDLAGSMAAAELAMRQDDRERAGLVNLGPGALDLAAAMDASAGRALGQVRTGTLGSRGGLEGQIAAAAPMAPPTPGTASFIVFGTLISSLDQFATEPQSITVPYDDETVEVEGNTGTIKTTITLKAVVSGSNLSVDLTLKTKGQVVDKATGAILFAIDSIASGHIDVAFCPDAGGQSTANVKLTSSEIYTGGAAGAGKGTSKEFSGTVVITVGDDAKIVKIEGTDQGSEESKGGIPPTGSSTSDLAASTRTASDNIAMDGGGNRVPGVPRNIQLGGEGSTSGEQGGLWGSMTIFVETMVTAAAQEAEKLWREGKCVELTVDPDGGDVEPNETKTVTATLRHKIEGTELDKPVEATFSGVKEISPVGEKQPAPASITFTAGPKEGDVGRIAFKSVSNRGIAEKAVIFAVRRLGWKVTFTGTEREVFAPTVDDTFQATITDLTIVSKDGVLSGTGKLHLKGKIKTFGCSGALDQVATITVYQGSLVGSGPEAMLHLVLRASSRAGQVIRMTCIDGQHVDLPARGHAERFGQPLIDLVLPAVPGSYTVSKTGAVGGVFQITVRGTFTVAIAH